MLVKPRVYSSIGTPQITLQNATGVGSVMTFSIPKEIIGDVSLECLRYGFHNNLLSEEQQKQIIELGEILSGVAAAKNQRKK